MLKLQLFLPLTFTTCCASPPSIFAGVLRIELVAAKSNVLRYLGKQNSRWRFAFSSGDASHSAVNILRIPTGCTFAVRAILFIATLTLDGLYSASVHIVLSWQTIIRTYDGHLAAIETVSVSRTCRIGYGIWK